MVHADRVMFNLCGGKNDMFETAQQLYRLAQTKTSPGSGYDLGKWFIALPAICAYIASEELGDNFVSLDAARVACCLSAKAFKSALKIVTNALAHSNSTIPEDVSYTSLIKQYKFPVAMQDKMNSWMSEVETALLDADKRWDADATLRCAVFCWVCALLEVDRVHDKMLLNQYDLPSKTFDAICKALDKVCDRVGQRIGREVRRLRAEKRRSPLKGGGTSLGSSPAKSPFTSPAKSASNSALKRASQSSSPPKNTGLKRKVIFDHSDDDDRDDDSAPETPTKRPRITRSIKLTLPSRLANERYPSSTGSGETKIDIMDQGAASGLSKSPPHPSTSRRDGRGSQDRNPSPGSPQEDMNTAMSSSEDEEEIPRSGRFRPVFMDRQQWFRQDPLSRHFQETTQAHYQKLVALYGSPLKCSDSSGR